MGDPTLQLDSFPRAVHEAYSGELVLFPYERIEVLTSDGSDFEAKLPLKKGVDPTLGAVEYIESGAPKRLCGRFVYLLMNSKALASHIRDHAFRDAFELYNDEDELTSFAGALADKEALELTGKTFNRLEAAPFVLHKLLIVECVGGQPVYYAIQAPLVRQEAAAGKAHEKNPVGCTWFEVLLYEEHALWAFSSPFALSAQQIEALENVEWAEFPAQGVGPGAPRYLVAIREPGKGVKGAYALGVPVVDPLLILENLTKRYEKACEAYLAHATDFERLEQEGAAQLGANQPNAEELARGRENYLRLSVARILQGIAEVQPSISAELKGGLRAVTRFVDQYRNRIESLCQEREVAAQDLAVWLESKPIALIDDASRSSGGVPQVENASVYLRAMCVGMRRLHETSAGTHRLAKAIERAHERKDPGLVRVLAEYVLPERKPESGWLDVNREVAAEVYEAAKASHMVVLQMIAEGHEFPFLSKVSNAAKSLRERSNAATREFVKRVNCLFGEAFLEFIEREPEFKALTEAGVKNLHKLRVSAYPSVKGALSDAVELHGVGLGAINVALTLIALVEAREEAGSEASKANAAFTFAQAYAELASEVAGVFALKQAARHLSTFGSAFGLVAAVAGTREKYDQHDWDAMMGEVVGGAGAALAFHGSVLITMTPKGGPKGGWFLFFGALLSGAGTVWSHYFTDSAYQQLAKFCEFGLEKGASVPAPPWALVEKFKDWSPPHDAAKGLEIQIAAGRQLFHGFTVEGHESDRDIIVITPSALTARSGFHIQFRAFYFKRFPQDGESLTLDAFQVDGSVRVDVQDPFSKDGSPGVTNYGSVAVVVKNAVKSRQRGGQRVLEVMLRPDLDPKINSFDVREGLVKNPRLVHLECLVRLDVNGDGGVDGAKGSLVIPRAEDGWVHFEWRQGAKSVQAASFGTDLAKRLRTRHGALAGR